MYAVILFTLLFAAALPASAVCPDGWIGVGQSQFCQVIPQPICGGSFATLFANNCGQIAQNWNGNGDWCVNTYSNDAWVDCVGGYQSQPYLIWTQGGYFGNCQPASNDDAIGCYGFQMYNPITWCCSPS